MTALVLKDISFSYNGTDRILDGVNLTVESGEAVGIVGKSGCGKSTLAMIACGVIPKAVEGEFGGSVLVFGEDIKDKKLYQTASKISMVLQDPESQLFSPLVADEVAFAPENLCYDMPEINWRVDNSLEAVNITKAYNHSPNDLSGGQQQLVALASVLSLDPEIIILDEAAAQIDKEGVGLIYDAGAALESRGNEIIIVEHERVLGDLCDRTYILENGKLEELV